MGNRTTTFDNVLYVGPSHKHGKGGVASVIKEYSNYINNFQYHPTTKSSIILTSLLFPLTLLSFIIRLAKNKKISIIHIHGASKGSFYRKYLIFVISKFLFGKKTIYHIHGAKYHIFYKQSSFLVKGRIKHMVQKSDALVVLSSRWKDFFENNFNPKSVIIIPNIVANVSKNNSTVNFINGKTTFLFLGRIGERKGVFDLIEVIYRGIEYFRENCKFVVGGDGETKRLEQLIKSYDIGSTIKFVGFVSGDKKKKLLTDTDVYVLPSYNEGLPISILEAMAYSKPVISTTVGGIPELIKHKKNGLLFEPGDLSALDQCLRLMVENRDERLAMGNLNYDSVSSSYFPAPVIDKLSLLYNNL